VFGWIIKSPLGGCTRARVWTVNYNGTLVYRVQVGHYGHVSGTEDETCAMRPRPRPWSARSELFTKVRPPNRTIGHLYDAVLRHQRTCSCHLRDVTDDDEASPATTSTLCCCRPSASRPKRTRFSGWTRKKKR